MANLTQDESLVRRERNRIRMHKWYSSLTKEKKLDIFKRQRDRYRNASPELLEKRRIRNRRWYAKHPEVIHSKNRRPSQRFSYSKSRAARLGYEWNISRLDFIELISKRCHYCDGSLSETGCGLDRMDNSKGYIIGNIVPCCMSCNKIKRDLLTYDEMVVAMKSVMDFRFKRAVNSLG